MLVNLNKLLLVLVIFLNDIPKTETILRVQINNTSLKKIYLFGKSKQNRYLIQNELNYSRKIHNFSGNNSDNGFSNWIEENIVLFCVIIVIIVIVIIVIIVLIIVCRKMKNKFKELQIQVNKISFQSDIRDSRQTEDNDKLI